MVQFQFRAVEPDGNIVKGEIAAEDEAAAISQLRNKRMIPLEVTSSAMRGGSRRGAFNLKNLALLQPKATARGLLSFSRELATLLNANLPMDRAIALIGQNHAGDLWGNIADTLLKDVHSGKSLADAMSGWPDAFPDYYIGMVRAGEVAGTLPLVLDNLCDGLERTERMRDAVVSSLRYPAIVLIVGLLSILFIFITVIPEFRQLYAGREDAMPYVTRAIFWLSAAIHNWAWLWLLGLLLAILAFRRYADSENGRLTFDRWKRSLPLFGGLIRDLETGRFASNLGMLLRNGVPMLSALDLTLGLLKNSVVKERLLRLHQRVGEGTLLSVALEEAGELSPTAVALIRVGEETGRLPDMLAHLADVQDRDTRRRIDGILDLLTPVLMLLLGGLVALVVGSMLVTIVSTYDLPTR